MSEEVPYGYKKVSPSEKRNLIKGHFDVIARRYDLADTLLSFGLHFLWRRRALRRLKLRPGSKVLDLCAGTGDFSVLSAREIGPEGKTVACDLSREMMDAGRNKSAAARLEERICWVQGDAEHLGFARASFDAVIIGYGIRNFVFLDKGLQEIFRVLKPGGSFMAMEFSIPESALIKKLYHFYSFKIMPGAGKLITGTAEPFHYLVESIRVFPAPDKIRALLSVSGFTKTGYERLSNGLAVLYFGKKPKH